MLNGSEVDSIKGKHVNVVYTTPEILYCRPLQTGAGGLGVVAGSFMEEVENGFSRHGITAIAISTFPTHGYQKQYATHVDGRWQMATRYERSDCEHLLKDTGLRVKLILAGKPCHVAVKIACERERIHTALLFLDTNIPENTPEYRIITAVLYGEGHATAHFDEQKKPWRNIAWLRILQAAVLGIGSYQLLKMLGITYDKIHLNESHPVFFLINQIGEYILEDRKNYTEALNMVRDRAVFTNHTVLESGNKWYSFADVQSICGEYLGFSHEILTELCGGSQPSISMTDLALKLVGRGNANGVSVHHADIANKIWPGYDIIPITNGTSDCYVHSACMGITHPQDIPELKRFLKMETLRVLKDNAHEAGYEITITEKQLTEAVLIAWARRCQLYKRPGMVWHPKELDGVVRTLLEWGYIAIAWGGYVHPDDGEMVHNWNRYWQRFVALPNTIPVFNYRMELMMLLKAGAQVWLNTPIYGNEACGTSWMSAMRNFALVISIPDGGIREATRFIPFGTEETGNWHTQYEKDATEMWQTIVQKTMSLRENDPRLLRFLFDANQEAKEKFSAKRMVDDYITKLYKFKR